MRSPAYTPRAPGGGSDNLARLLSPGLEKKLGVPTIVDNRPDATAVLGATLVAKAKPPVGVSRGSEGIAENFELADKLLAA